MIGGPMIHVSSLGALNSVTASLDSFDLLTLLSPDQPETDWREFACTRHLRLAFHDIVEPAIAIRDSSATSPSNCAGGHPPPRPTG